MDLSLTTEAITKIATRSHEKSILVRIIIAKEQSSFCEGQLYAVHYAAVRQFGCTVCFRVDLIVT